MAADLNISRDEVFAIREQAIAKVEAAGFDDESLFGKYRIDPMFMDP